VGKIWVPLGMVLVAGVTTVMILQRQPAARRGSRRSPLTEDDEYYGRTERYRQQAPKEDAMIMRRQPQRPSSSEAEAIANSMHELTNGREGFTMEDAQQHAERSAAKAKAKTPREVLTQLQRGNARFWTGAARRPEASAFHRRALIMQQYPKVAVLGCSDSRVPVEIVFDQGLGDLFVIRVAGNCLDVATTASLEYAVHHLKVKVLVVLGHEGCGAVKAATCALCDIEKEPKDLALMLKKMKAGLDDSRLSTVYDSRARDREAVVTNVKYQVNQLAENEGIMAKVQSQELLVIGGFYEISSGIVDFFSEISPPDAGSDAV